MIDKEFEQQWQDVCSQLKEKCDDSLLHQYLGQIVPDVQQDTLILSVPNQFMFSWLQRKEYDVRLCELFQQFYPEVQTSQVRLQNAYSVSSKSVSDSFVCASPVKEEPVAAKTLQDEVRLNPQMTFENYVVGSSNEIAAAVAKGITERFDSACNPLFLHSSVGLGKTHLMNAIAWRMRQKHPEKKVIYLTAEQFKARYIRSLRADKVIQSDSENQTEHFRELFRSADILMVDDIQFLCGNKKATQMEFFHTFNSLIEQGKQIVLSSDSSPQELKDMEERLKSRMAQGLIVDIYPTTYEMRIGILQSKAEQWGVSLPQDVVEFLAERITTNVRELEGALKRLIVNTGLLHLPLTLASTQQILKDVLNLYPVEVSVSDIIKAVSDYFMVKIADLKSTRRDRSIARPRQIAMYLAKELTSKSLPEIGSAFERDHTTIMHAIKVISQLVETDASVASCVQTIKRSFIH